MANELFLINFLALSLELLLYGWLLLKKGAYIAEGRCRDLLRILCWQRVGTGKTETFVADP
jgi:hypothetical protein